MKRLINKKDLEYSFKADLIDEVLVNELINENTKFETNAIQHITGIINPTSNLILPTYQPK